MAEKKPIQISGKNLSALNMPDACPRCFWIKNTVKNLPYQTFPGIFASIDSYTKKVVHSHFDANGCAPAWLSAFAAAKRYLPVPHWQKFKRVDPETGIVVTGVVDDLLECADGSVIIPDYKTARFTDGQDELLPIYIAQLNVYRWIHESTGGRVRSLPLIYFEPQTDGPIVNDIGFDMRFVPKTVMVDMDDTLVQPLIARAHEILTNSIPAKAAGCGECDKMGALLSRCIP